MFTCLLGYACIHQFWGVRVRVCRYKEVRILVCRCLELRRSVRRWLEVSSSYRRCFEIQVRARVRQSFGVRVIVCRCLQVRIGVFNSGAFASIRRCLEVELVFKSTRACLQDLWGMRESSQVLRVFVFLLTPVNTPVYSRKKQTNKQKLANMLAYPKILANTRVYL